MSWDANFIALTKKHQSMIEIPEFYLSFLQILYGSEVRIVGSHPVGLGSIPTKSFSNFFSIFLLFFQNSIDFNSLDVILAEKKEFWLILSNF